MINDIGCDKPTLSSLLFSSLLAFQLLWDILGVDNKEWGVNLTNQLVFCDIIFILLYWYCNRLLMCCAVLVTSNICLSNNLLNKFQREQTLLHSCLIFGKVRMQPLITVLSSDHHCGLGKKQPQHVYLKLISCEKCASFGWNSLWNEMLIIIPQLPSEYQVTNSLTFVYVTAQPKIIMLKAWRFYYNLSATQSTIVVSWMQH